MLMRAGEGRPSVPAGMVEVSKEEFFTLLYADKRDIMPAHNDPSCTVWRVVATHARWGWDAPGWKVPRAHAPIYAVMAEVRR